ncbi:MAG: hypothetical protein U0Z17_07300 [Bacteroidales bacterium]
MPIINTCGPFTPEFDIFVADLKGNIVKRLPTHPVTIPEATVSPDGKKLLLLQPAMATSIYTPAISTGKM